MGVQGGCRTRDGHVAETWRKILYIGVSLLNAVSYISTSARMRYNIIILTHLAVCCFLGPCQSHHPIIQANANLALFVCGFIITGGGWHGDPMVTKLESGNLQNVTRVAICSIFGVFIFKYCNMPQLVSYSFLEISNWIRTSLKRPGHE